MTAAPPTPSRPELHALSQRLRVGLAALGTSSDHLGEDSDPTTAGRLLTVFVERVRASGSTPELWLLLTLLAGGFPDSATLRRSQRRLRVSGVQDGAAFLLQTVLPSVDPTADRAVHAVVLTDQVVVDVDFCATNEHHTGIQRVVRETVPHWTREHPLTLVGWWEDRACYRHLGLDEQERVLEWGTRAPAEPTRHHAQALVVPFRCRVVLPETPDSSRSAVLACLAQHSGNVVGMIGYDCIPLVSPELVHPGLPDRFMQYLSVVKHAHHVAGISQAATTEFAGFADMLVAQGLPGPVVTGVPLPADTLPEAAEPSGEPPLVLSIGSFEPRKNQLTVLVAAEELWRQGVRFRLRFIGGGGYPTEFDAVLARIRAAGRPVEVRVRVSEQELLDSYAEARFTVFVSLHEGYGLPVTESLAHGTPVLTTGYGSTGEIAAAGGCVTVDPRDGVAVREGLRQMLTDDGLLARLRREAADREPRTWSEYADELWADLVAAPAPAEVPR